MAKQRNGKHKCLILFSFWFFSCFVGVCSDEASQHKDGGDVPHTHTETTYSYEHRHSHKAHKSQHTVPSTQLQQGVLVDASSMPPFVTPVGTFIYMNNDTKKQHLGIDKAWLTIVNTIDYDITLYGQADSCWQCPLQRIIDVLPSSHNTTVLISTQFKVTLQVKVLNQRRKEVPACTLYKSLSEHGDYHLFVNLNLSETTFTCNFLIANNPMDTFIPIYVALACFLVMSLFWILIKFLHRNNYIIKIMVCLETERLVNSDLGTPTNVTPDDSDKDKLPAKRRLRSLDAFRGLSLTLMIFVNYGGGQYWFFSHSYWNGVTVADLLFPWFTFIIGTSIALAFHGLLRRATPRRTLLWKVVKRTVILFAIGLFLNGNGGGKALHITELRIPGVLQRLAASYFVVAALQAAFAQATDPHQHKWWARVRDIVPFWAEWLVMTGLLAIHLGLTFLLPIEGCPTGYLGPGGIQYDSKYENCTGGAAGYIDRWIFGDAHIYQHPTCKNTYMSTVPYDPEGVLGTLTSVFMCFLGLQAGKILLYYQDWVQRIHRWLIWGVVVGLIGGILCKFSQNDGWIPLNKNLWSLSFVLSLSAMAFVLFTALYLLIDVFNIWSGAPFVYPGMNSIVVYVCHEVFEHFFPVSFYVRETHAAQLAMNLWGAAFWVIVSMVLYYKKVFISI